MLFLFVGLFVDFGNHESEREQTLHRSCLSKCLRQDESSDDATDTSGLQDRVRW